MKNLTRFFLIVLWGLAAVLSACGLEDDSRRDGGVDDDTGNDTQSETDDTGQEEEDTGMDGSCDAFPSTFSESSAFVFNHQSLGRIIQYTAFDGLMEGHAWSDAVFDLSLFKEFGAVFQPGQIDLGSQSNFATCAYCLRFQQGVSMNNGNPTSSAHTFMPESGTLTFESLSDQVGGTFKFIIDAKMIEVTIDSSSQTIPVQGGCSFDLNGFQRTAILKD